MNCTGLNSADGGSFSGTSTITFLSTRCRAPGGSVLPPGPGSIDPVGSGDMLPLKECAPNVTAKCVAQTPYPFRLPARAKPRPHPKRPLGDSSNVAVFSPHRAMCCFGAQNGNTRSHLALTIL